MIKYLLSLVGKQPVVMHYYGYARSVIAFSTLLTLLFNDTEVIFFSPNPLDKELLGFSIFTLLDLGLAKLLSCFLLLVVISGWRPRITGILHWYITFSYAVSGDILVGGDHIANIICVFLIPISLVDGRKWIWHKSTNLSTNACIIANMFHFAIIFQASLIYFHAFSSKLPHTEWANGTAVYYWFNHPNYGAPIPLLKILNPVLQTSLGVVLMTWGSLVIEVFLFVGVFVQKIYRKPLFLLGVSFHIGIALAHGLITFSMVMSALLFIYLIPSFRFLKLDESQIKPTNSD